MWIWLGSETGSFVGHAVEICGGWVYFLSLCRSIVCMKVTRWALMKADVKEKYGEVVVNECEGTETVVSSGKEDSSTWSLSTAKG